MPRPGRQRGVPKAECPDCGKTFNATDLTAHRRRIHDVYARSPKVVAKAKNDGVLNLNPTEAKLFEDDEGHVYLVERIR